MSDVNVVPKIKKEAKSVEESILKRKTPSLKFPIRSLANVRISRRKATSRSAGRRRSGRSR